MQNESYQIVTPVSAPQGRTGESMTFSSELTRNRYIREQRANGWEVFLSYQGTDGSNKELYTITRRAL